MHLFAEDTKATEGIIGYPRLCISKNSKEFGLLYATSRFQHKFSSQQ